MDPVLGRKVLDHAVANRELFRMSTFGTESSCGTIACLAGHAMLQSGYTYCGYTVDRDDCGYFRPDGTFVTNEIDEARELLSLTDAEYYGDEDAESTLFAWQDNDRAIERFRALVEAAEAAGGAVN